MPSTIQVAIGIIIDQNDQVLIAKRASHQHQGDKWEFPGGKVEENENSQQALHRELKEEVGIDVHASEFQFSIQHHYEDLTINFDVFEVRNWTSQDTLQCIGREGQPLLWVEKTSLNQYKFPAANVEILSKLDFCG